MVRKIAIATGFVVLWSSGFVGAVLAEPAGSQAGVLAWRYMLTVAILGAALLVVGSRPISRGELAREVTMGLLAHVLFLGGVFAASEEVDAGTVALVCALQPMLVTLAGRVWWGDAVTPRRLTGLLIGLLAVGLTVGGAGAVGPVLVLPALALLGLTAAAVLERRWRSTTAVLTSLAIQVTVAATVFTGFAAATGRLGIEVTGEVAGALLWLTVLSGLGGYAFFVMSLRSLGGTTTSLLLYLTPPVTTVWAWLALAQTPTATQWVGLGLGAVAVAMAWPHRVTPPSPPGTAAPGAVTAAGAPPGPAVR